MRAGVYLASRSSAAPQLPALAENGFERGHQAEHHSPASIALGAAYSPRRRRLHPLHQHGGLSDDDPAGITTYSILGAKYGYKLLWVLALSTAVLVIFHELGVRLGIVTGKGLLTLVRERFGQRAAGVVVAALVIANTGTLCAEFAGVAAGMQLLASTSRYPSVPLVAIGVSALVLRENFRRVEHVLLALSSVFVTNTVAGFLAHPDWGATAMGLVVPNIPLTRDAVLVAVATVGTTLAPWGLASIARRIISTQFPLAVPYD